MGECKDERMKGVGEWKDERGWKNGRMKRGWENE